MAGQRVVWARWHEKGRIFSFLFLLLCFCLSGCTSEGQSKSPAHKDQTVQSASMLKHVIDDEDSFPPIKRCKTVVLYDHEFVKTNQQIPPRNEEFYGNWGNGEWDSKLCFGLAVLEVGPEGKVRAVMTTGYYNPWGVVPTAFARTGEIDEEYVLHFHYGETHDAFYIGEDGKMLGVRWIKGQRMAGITLERKPL